MFWKKKNIPEEKTSAKTQPVEEPDRDNIIRQSLANVFQGYKPKGYTATMDDAAAYYAQQGIGNNVPAGVLNWYSNQSFIGYQTCMILAQHWLINAACSIPVDDAIRKGWQVIGNDGKEIPVEAISALKKEDKRLNIGKIANDFGKFGRVFGYRIAIFLVKGYDADDYANPFNPDGITEGAYDGIIMPDPYYVVPMIESTNPNEAEFYEPEYWQVAGIKYHKSHCVVWRHDELPQLLKPVYLYGGVPLPQQIYEKVYQAELAANESNKLLMTKRLWVQNCSIETAIADQYEAENRIKFIQQMRDNYGVLLIDSDDSVNQMDTPLAEVTNVIAQKYEHVAAVARMPANKLMQCQLQGFASTGEAEEGIYHETLQSLQTKCLQPLLEKHTLYSLRNLGLDFEFEISFNPLDCPSETEQAMTNQTKAATDQVLVATGAIDASEVRSRIINDPTSGYSGLDDELPAQPNYDDDNEPDDDDQTATTEPDSLQH